jgi:hypothetical protein
MRSPAASFLQEARVRVPAVHVAELPPTVTAAMVYKDVTASFRALARSGRSSETKASDLQKKVDDSVAFFNRAMPRGAKLTISLVFDLVAATPLHLRPLVGNELSPLAKRLRQKVLYNQQRATDAELNELNGCDACACPLLQWQWLSYIARVLRPVANCTLLLARCPLANLFQHSPSSYTDFVHATKAYVTRPGGLLINQLAHTLGDIQEGSFPHGITSDAIVANLIAQQLVVLSEFCISQVPGDERPAPMHLDSKTLFLAAAQGSQMFAGEALAQIIPWIVAHLFRPNRAVTVIDSEHPDALVLVIAALASKCASTGHLESLPGSACFLKIESGFVDLGALFNYLWKQQQQVGAQRAFPRNTIYMWVLAHLLAGDDTELHANLAALIANDGMNVIDTVRTSTGEVSLNLDTAAIWYQTAWERRLTTGPLPDPPGAHRFMALAVRFQARIRNIALPPLNEASAIVARAFAAAFKRVPHAAARGSFWSVFDAYKEPDMKSGYVPPVALRGDALYDVLTDSLPSRLFIETRGTNALNCYTAALPPYETSQL